MKDIKKWQIGCLESYMSKLEELKKLKEQLQLEIVGKNNIPSDAPSVIISNHNRLMDIFYLPFAFDEDIISLVSARLVYKQDQDRLSYINKYLNAFPIEAHGGKTYSNIPLPKASAKFKRKFHKYTNEEIHYLLKDFIDSELDLKTYLNSIKLDEENIFGGYVYSAFREFIIRELNKIGLKYVANGKWGFKIISI